jgi:beta-N-acetylhexosaminidase
MRCGELVIGGFGGTALPDGFARALREGRRGGAILFKPNVEGGVTQVASLCRSLHATSPDLAPIVSVDQEGGRVARLRAPLLEVPPMRTVGSWGDEALAERIAHAVGVELAALGFTVDYAPVLDVDTCPDNPVIGDRAFSSDAETCGRFGAAWTRGLQSAGLLACGKHFPGHGDTTKDSHVDLPVVDLPRERLERVELAPFRAAAAAGLSMIMTAHVVYTALDARPATLSPAASTVLRGALPFEGVLVSDDLEMKAVAARWSIEESAVLAVAAGCDALLVCWSDALQERAVEALEREAARSPAFRDRCEQARERVRAARRRIKARPLGDSEIATVVGSPQSRAMASEMRARAEPRASRDGAGDQGAGA